MDISIENGNGHIRFEGKGGTSIIWNEIPSDNKFLMWNYDIHGDATSMRENLSFEEACSAAKAWVEGE